MVLFHFSVLIGDLNVSFAEKKLLEVKIRPSSNANGPVNKKWEKFPDESVSICMHAIFKLNGSD